MPNWCTNRLYFRTSGDIWDAEELRIQLDNSKIAGEIAAAIHTARQLFLMVFCGAIRVVPELYGLPPLNWMSKYGGARIDLNKDVDYHASNIINTFRGKVNNTLMERLHLYAVTNRWGELTQIAEAMPLGWEEESWLQAKDLLKEVWYDWCPEPPKQPAGPVEPEINLMAYVRPPLLPELNGYNGKFAPDQKDGFNSRVELYGTKWVDCHYRVGSQDGLVYVDFDTAWSPPKPTVLEAIPSTHPEMQEHFYAERGVGYCGHGIVMEPGLMFYRSSDLDITYDQNDEIVSVDPSWIENKVDGYGG